MKISTSGTIVLPIFEVKKSLKRTFEISAESTTRRCSVALWHWYLKKSICERNLIYCIFMSVTKNLQEAYDVSVTVASIGTLLVIVGVAVGIWAPILEERSIIDGPI
jgi:hypothetical protein